MAVGRREPTSREVYEMILDRLSNLGAHSLIRDIQQAVSRGVLITSPAELMKQAAATRDITDDEQLSVALEFLIAACEPPLMMESAKNQLGCEEIVWSADERVRDEEEVPLQNLQIGDNAHLREALTNLSTIMRDLRLKLPEVA